MKSVFYAVVGADLGLKFLNTAKIKTHLLQFRGQTVEVTVERRRKLRTQEQNAYYWGVVVKMIADECGYRTAEEQQGVHVALREKFLPRKGKLQIASSTAALDTAQFTDYIEQVRQWAAEDLGIYIPDPNEAKANEEV